MRTSYYLVWTRVKRVNILFKQDKNNLCERHIMSFEQVNNNIITCLNDLCCAHNLFILFKHDNLFKLLIMLYTQVNKSNDISFHLNKLLTHAQDIISHLKYWSINKIIACSHKIKKKIKYPFQGKWGGGRGYVRLEFFSDF